MRSLNQNVDRRDGIQVALALLEGSSKSVVGEFIGGGGAGSSMPAIDPRFKINSALQFTGFTQDWLHWAHGAKFRGDRGVYAEQHLCLALKFFSKYQKLSSSCVQRVNKSLEKSTRVKSGQCSSDFLQLLLILHVLGEARAGGKRIIAKKLADDLGVGVDCIKYAGRPICDFIQRLKNDLAYIDQLLGVKGHTLIN